MSPLKSDQAVQSDEIQSLVDENQRLSQRIVELERLLQNQTTIIERLECESLTDRLTGLGNRRAFEQDLAQQSALTQRFLVQFSLVVFDIDHFKQVNDRNGHPIGDTVLVQFARILATGHRASDFAARLGGDEFGLLLPQTRVAGALVAAERIRREVAATIFQIEGLELRIQVSAGIAEAVPGEPEGALLARADAALYRAKAAGRDSVRQ